MHAFLLSIGLIATAIGMFTIGFGIPISEFSFGNTLISAGTVSVMGGLVLIGLSAAVRELRRIADALAGRPASRSARSDLTETLGVRGARGTFPPKPNAEVGGRETRSEPRLTTVYSNDAPSDETVGARPRPNIVPIVRAVGDAALVEEPDSVPLSPQASARATLTAPSRSERAADVKPAQQTSKSGAGSTPAARSTVLEVPRIAPAADRPADKPQRGNLFDAVWPAGSTAAESPAANEASATAKKAANPRERIEPVLPAAKRGDAAAAPRAAVDPRPVSILKSGVIDGMAYTLYTDGSIEAQLAEGTMRFNSIDALREHLESHP
jgi:hypothetical protein